MNHFDPIDLPTWHERDHQLATPEGMEYVLQAEDGCRGEFGHHYWAEHHPYYTESLKGYEWLPGIKMFEVPMNMRDNTVVDIHGRVFLKVVVDPRLTI